MELGGISNIFTLIVNSLFDINDAMNSKSTNSLNANVIELVCVCTDDLGMDFINQYTKSLEVVYATLVRSILQSSIRNRGNSSPANLFKSLPILTNFDAVQFNKELGSISSVATTLFRSNVENGGAAVNAFLESVNANMAEMEVKEFGLEADVFLKETRGGVPTFIDVAVTITVPGGRTIEKTIPIGISVKPKILPPAEVISFFIKQNNLATVTSDEAAKAKRFSFKSMFTKAKLNKIVGGALDNSDKRVLNQLLESTKNISKPFVCLLVSSYTSNLLLDAGVDVTKPTLLKNLYSRLPIMSMAIYDSNMDTIRYSLTRGQTTLINTTASSFNTDISQLQKTLAEGLRVSKLLS